MPNTVWQSGMARGKATILPKYVRGPAGQLLSGFLVSTLKPYVSDSIRRASQSKAGSTAHRVTIHNVFHSIYLSTIHDGVFSIQDGAGAGTK